MCFAVTLKFPEGRQYRLRGRGKRARSNNPTRTDQFGSGVGGDEKVQV